MSNEIAPVDPNLYEVFGEAATRSMAFLKFSKGDFLRGQDGAVVPIGTKFVADMPNLTTGWVRWNSGAPTERILGRVGEGWVPPCRAELGDADKGVWETDTEGRPRDPWQMSNELPLISKDGSVETFATSSRGGLNAIGEGQNTRLGAVCASAALIPVIQPGRITEAEAFRFASAGTILPISLRIWDRGHRENTNSTASIQTATTNPKIANGALKLRLGFTLENQSLSLPSGRQKP
jgi:hypothetical protein